MASEYTMSAERVRRGNTRVVIVDDDDVNRSGMASLLAGCGSISVVGTLVHAEALHWTDDWQCVDVAIVDPADEREAVDHFPGVAVVEQIRRHRPPGEMTIVVVTGHFFDDAVRRRMREANADFFYHRSEVGVARVLYDVVLRPELCRRVPGPGDPEALFRLGVTDSTTVNRAVLYASEHRFETVLGEQRSRRALVRLRRTFNREARLSPVTVDGRPPDRDQVLPSLPQIARFLAWATRVKTKSLPAGEEP